MTDESSVKYLNFLVRSYEGVTQLITKVKQRLQSLPGEGRDEDFDTLLKGEGKAEGLETVKGRISRELEKELQKWDIWELWAKEIPGIGAYLAAELVILYYYRFIPVCKDCGGGLSKKDRKADNGKVIKSLVCDECGKLAKDGLLKHKLDYKDFPTISKWWAYMGMHTVEGVKPRRKSGEVANWSTVGRTICYHVGEMFNRQTEDHPYKALLLERKAKHARKHPEWSKGHVHNAAKNEVAKIFLAHWWSVARELEGKDVSEPYAGALMGHTNIITPYYWDGMSDGVPEPEINRASSQCEARV